ncbi:hypothetical protein [Kribbella sp. VKM Ac-2566]|uniref:hypothetical protein n=1 Tax=Kribbella sp. VKM Ac-2566 TaxID=2512218 RepID=UPI001EDF2064|nr:hypothetical protein [Kribbella sp. VKM Ac-2566]
MLRPDQLVARSRLISNPSAFVLGKPGLGKSTVVRRMALGLAGHGVQPLILGDLKPDYRDLIEALDGQVIDLAPGRGKCTLEGHHHNGKGLEPLPWATPPAELYDPLTYGA